MNTRFYYSNTIAEFLSQSDNEIIGSLIIGSVSDINQDTTYAWNIEIATMKKALSPYAGKGTIFMEYNIPRMGRRIDVVTIIDGIVIIWEYKAGGEGFNREAITQVWDYALDLKNFQEGSRDRCLIPVLVATDVPDKNCRIELNPFEDNVYEPLLTNVTNISYCIEKILSVVSPYKQCSPTDDMNWAKSGYAPTPTIVEAAVALFNNHSVEDITKHDGDIAQTSIVLNEIISFSRENNRKSICFVTGVPGAGKTLIGLQTAINHTKDSGAVYLSGNGPLVDVLQEALARDYVKRDKARLMAEKKEGKTTVVQKATTKKEAHSKVKEFIQIIHHYRDTYLQGIQVVGDTIEAVPGYFNLEKNKDKSYVPHEHVVIFDEAQRAWDQAGLSKFLNDKSKGRSNLLKDFPYSEPEYLISTIERHDDWGVVICLIGGGQEINHNEAGIQDWMNSINRRFSDWDVYISDRLTGNEYTDKEGNIVSPANVERLSIKSGLHLPMSMRSFRAEKVSLFVHQLLDLDKEGAKETLLYLENYPIVLTRDLDSAKDWLRKKARGSERYGLLASSKAERLKAISINVRYQPDFVQWFLADENDIRSSNYLEDTLTEFKVQGLEIDWACVVWDADLRLDKSNNRWDHYQLRGGTNWQHINKFENQQFQINAYRVLLTRARQGLVIVVPNGDYGVPPDETRKPEWYDGVYDYIKELGIKEL